MPVQQLRFCPEILTAALENDPSFDQNDVSLGERAKAVKVMGIGEFGTQHSITPILRHSNPLFFSRSLKR